jgi:hypothetical protein
MRNVSRVERALSVLELMNQLRFSHLDATNFKGLD